MLRARKKDLREKFKFFKKMRHGGIELPSQPWEGCILPLN